MNDYASTTKQILISLIDEMNAADYVYNPHSNFTKNRKLNLPTTVRLILSMGVFNLGTETLKYFDFNYDFPSISAFIQQR